jgi:hypothetical protein
MRGGGEEEEELLLLLLLLVVVVEEEGSEKVCAQTGTIGSEEKKKKMRRPLPLDATMCRAPPAAAPQTRPHLMPTAPWSASRSRPPARIAR